jgi:hypothetical protein
MRSVTGFGPFGRRIRSCQDLRQGTLPPQSKVFLGLPRRGYGGWRRCGKYYAL